MFRFNTHISLGRREGNSIQNQNTGKFIDGRNFPYQSFNNTNLQMLRRNNNISHEKRPHDWFKGSQALRFMPEHSTLNVRTTQYSTSQSYCNPSTDCQRKQWYGRDSYKWYPIKPSHSTLRSVSKRKRKRTIFTTEQIIALEGVFQKKPYISREERILMMNNLRVSEKAIKVWFQNRRRMTDKRCQDYMSQTSSSPENKSDSVADKLASIETEIKLNTDENGYVVLNENVMNELVCIIDDCLSKKSYICGNGLNSNSRFADNTAMYEPISPASSEELDERLI